MLLVQFTCLTVAGTHLKFLKHTLTIVDVRTLFFGSSEDVKIFFTVLVLGPSLIAHVVI